jgi:hypothetical protein
MEFFSMMGFPRTNFIIIVFSLFLLLEFQTSSAQKNVVLLVSALVPSSLRISQLNDNKTVLFQARWDEASKVAIKVTTKPCPKCRTPTERSGDSC